jgi:hypothetical protein
MYRELLTGGKDELSITRKRAAARRIDISVAFDRTCRLTGRLRRQPLNGCSRPSQVVGTDGSLTGSATYGPARLPEVVGFLLDNRDERT